MKSRLIILAVLTALILIYTAFENTQEQNNQVNNQVIRVHIIANSDSPKDQAVKIMVRDRILGSIGDKLADADSIDESRRIVIDNLTMIERIAQDEINKSNQEYTVKVSLGNSHFPTKRYGALVLPAGSYEALNVVIGEGCGKNWWCVMFPPLCFVDITHGIAENHPADNLDNDLLQPGAGPTVSDDEHNKPEFNVDFKLAEIWNESKSTIARIFSFLNPNN